LYAVLPKKYPKQFPYDKLNQKEKYSLPPSVLGNEKEAEEGQWEKGGEYHE